MQTFTLLALCILTHDAIRNNSSELNATQTPQNEEKEARAGAGPIKFKLCRKISAIDLNTWTNL